MGFRVLGLKPVRGQVVGHDFFCFVKLVSCLYFIRIRGVGGVSQFLQDA